MLNMPIRSPYKQPRALVETEDIQLVYLLEVPMDFVSSGRESR